MEEPNRLRIELIQSTRGQAKEELEEAVDAVAEALASALLGAASVSRSQESINLESEAALSRQYRPPNDRSHNRIHSSRSEERS